MHVYPIPDSLSVSKQSTRPKRRQVKNACTRCQKACKKCDDARPCLRCVKYGITDECVNSQRKERKKGVKRGPYKKRDGRNRASAGAEHVDVSPQRAVTPTTVTSPPMPGSYVHIDYGHYPTYVSKSGDTASVHTTSYSIPPAFPSHLVPVYIVHPSQIHPIPEDHHQTQGYYLPNPVHYPPTYVFPRTDGTSRSSQLHIPGHSHQ